MTSGTYRVYLSREAQAEYARIQEWWSSNRLKAPEAVAEDVWDAVKRLAAYGPQLGLEVRHRRVPGLRRLELTRIRFWLYYRVNEAAREIEIAALWHTSRRRGPRL